MKYAIDRFVNNREGQEMEVSAADIYEQCHGGKPLRADTRFYCPECHERVFWHCRGGRLPDFFSHHAKTESSPELPVTINYVKCPDRISGFIKNEWQTESEDYFHGKPRRKTQS